ncbi:MAG: crossover junction endodeoxyribonuclease RuvC [Myxococcales bacterium]|nr:crossover junction endodeoxyribonuclease RuvC [Myxococcales bacterium]
MRVIGVDPGSRLCGFGVVERAGSRLVHVAHGTLDLADGELGDRLVLLEAGLAHAIAQHTPTAAAVESLFFAKNAQSAAKLGHARGVVLLCLRRAGLPVGEYAPAKVKKAIVGSGRAEKGQVARIVARLLGLAELPQPDAADALAVAITHLNVAAYAAALARA